MKRLEAASTPDETPKVGIAKPLPILPTQFNVSIPGISGIDLCERLKQDPATEDIPLIIPSTMSRPADKLRGFQCRAADYVASPFHKVELLARIGNQLKLVRMGEAIEARAEHQFDQLFEPGYTSEERPRRNSGGNSGRNSE
ncbi:Stalked cell differentiation-controlling protein [Thiorhodovibrio winogradskyi]|uniref:Stalked cell differentiation-controlling protein n=2 Tax=Thiorhodovibrio winogradskyi TaxID=77007 RepID=A0ABZ0S7Q6_9GAMM